MRQKLHARESKNEEKAPILLFFRKFFTYFTVVFFAVITTELLAQPGETYPSRDIVSLVLVILCVCVLFSELVQMRSVEAVFLIILSVIAAVDFILSCTTLSGQDELIRSSYYLVVSANFASLGFDRLYDVKNKTTSVASKKARKK
jgi:FlaA1/EpsC-like NDP-sugar epimerase